MSVRMIRNNEYHTGYLGDESAVCSPAFVQDSDALVMHRFEPADFKAPYRDRGARGGEGVWWKWWRGERGERGEWWRGRREEEVVEGGCGMRHEIILVEDMDGKRRGWIVRGRKGGMGERRRERGRTSIIGYGWEWENEESKGGKEDIGGGENRLLSKSWQDSTIDTHQKLETFTTKRTYQQNTQL